MLFAIFICHFFVLVVDGQFLASEPGQCSRKCVTTNEQLLTSNKMVNGYRCSCTSSCLLYRDCCYDYDGRVSGLKSPKLRKYCLPLEGKGHFLAVSSCPKSWKDSTEFCRTGLGHLVPVTSLETGTTYSNRYCAICNNDTKSVIDWSVDVKCDASDEIMTGGRFIYYRNQLWTVHGVDKTMKLNRCWYKLWDGKEHSLDKLDIRSCDLGREVASCSSSWRDDATRDMCKSYLDPVYVDKKVYRNVHCARCNYEREVDMHCIPPIVSNFRDHDVQQEIIVEYCKKRKLGSCIHYMKHSKGRFYAFAELLRINERTCIPPDGNRCCSGYQYDFRHKRCRKLVN